MHFNNTIVTDNSSGAYGANHTSQQVIAGYDDRYRSASHPGGWFNDSHHNTLPDHNQVSQVTTYPQDTHHSTYVDSGPYLNPRDQYANQSSHVDPSTSHPQSHHPTHVTIGSGLHPNFQPEDLYANQSSYVDPTGTSHLQSMHHPTSLDSGSHVNPQHQYANQPSCDVDPSTSYSQRTNHPTYVTVDSGLPNPQPEDLQANQSSYVDPTGTSHLQSMHRSTYVDTGSHLTPQDPYANQPSCDVDPSTSYSRSTYHSTYVTVDSGLHPNSQNQYASQSSYVDSSTSQPQSMHHPIHVDTGAHGNSQRQYTNRSSYVDPRTLHPGSMHLTSVDSGTHVNSQDQHVNQPSYTNPGTLHSQSMHHPIYGVDLGFHVNPQDQSANQPPYIDPGTSDPESMHDSVYATDSGGHMNPYDQYTNQSSGIAPQGLPQPHSVCVGSGPSMNPDDQYSNQRHDADSQGTSHPQTTYVSTYIDSRPHSNPRDQSANHSHFSNDHPGPEQLISVSRTTHHRPAHALHYHHRAGKAYYHAPQSEMSYERPDPLAQSSDWMHSSFDMHNASDGVEGEPSVDPKPAVNQHNFNGLRYHRTSNRHTPYAVSSRRNEHLTPRDVEHGEGTSHSATQSVLAPVIVPPLSPITVSPAPATLPLVSSTPSIPIIFGLANISEVKSRIHFRMKCSVFASSFFADVAAIETMANQCIDKEVLHDSDLVAWSKSEGGEVETSKLCNTLGTIRKTIQSLSRTAVLWGYDLHYFLMVKHKNDVKELIRGLVKDNRFLFGFIDVQGTQVEVVFGNVAIRYFVRQLLFHDKKYIKYIGQDRNIQHLLNFVGVLFNWVFSELSSGVFKDRDFKMNRETRKYSDELKKLFDTMPRDHRDALVGNIFTQGGVTI